MKLLYGLVLSVLAVGGCDQGPTAPPAGTPRPVLGFAGSAYAQVVDPAAPRALDLGAGTWTAEIWVKPEAGGERRQFLIGQWGDPGAASWGLELEAGYVIAETHNGAYSVRLTDSVAISLDTWHHVAFSFDRGSGTLYVDGKAVASSTQFPLPMTGVQPVRLGAQGPSWYGAMYMLTGELSEARLWSVARTGEEIAAGRSTRLRGNEAGLLAYWPLNEGAGDPKDAVKGVTAELGGAGHAAGEEPSWVQDPPPVTGGSGSKYVLRFDGSNYAAVPSPAAVTLDLGSNAWTAEVWVKPAPEGGRRQFLVGQWGDPGAASWALELEAGYVIAETHDGMRSLRLTDSVAIAPEAWHHVAFSFHGGSGTLYVDGKAVASSTHFPLPMSGAQPLRFGAQAPSSGIFTGATYPLSGRLAEVRLWSVVRTAQEIAGQRFERLKGDEAGLVAYWPLDEGGGDPADVVHGLVAELGGPGRVAAAAPAWVQDTPPLR